MDNILKQPNSINFLGVPLIAAIALFACTEPPRVAGRARTGGSSAPPVDAGMQMATPDAGSVSNNDTGTNTPPPTDAGMTAVADSGSTPPVPDAGTNPVDSGPPPPTGLPILGNGQHTASAVTIQVIANANAGLNKPTDIAFKPGSSDLWVVNQGDSTFTVLSIGGTSISSNNLSGGGVNVHFLAKPSALAFGAMGCGSNFRCLATSHDSTNDQPTITGGAPTDFMGPSLWTSDPTMYRGSGGYHNAHYDMLHNSPQGKGIAWERDNIYWYFDSYHQSITRYDFHSHHGPGGSDHSDGEISRWVQGFVSGVNNVPSHLEFDHSSNLLYIADTGNNRIASLNTRAGTRGNNYNEDYDRVTQAGGGGMYYMQAQLTTVVEGSTIGLVRPSGIAIYGDHIYVSDNSSGRIWGFTKSGTVVDYLETNKSGLAGITFDSTGNLLVADTTRQEILQISP